MKELQDMKTFSYPKNTEELAQIINLLRDVVILQQVEIDALKTASHSNQEPL